MAARMSTILKVTLLVLVAVLNQASALRCWQCSSINSPECDDPISQSEHHKSIHIKDCQSTVGQHSFSYEKSACRKLVQISNGKRIVTRSCYMPLPEERDITDGVCSSAPSASHTNVESCHICSTDVCNGAYSTLGQVSAMTSLLFFGIPSILFAYRWSY